MPVQLLLTPTARQDGDVYIVIRDGVPANVEAHGDGLGILNGTVAPNDVTDGVDGEFYINTVLWQIHGPKAAGVWPAGVDIVGEAGAFVGDSDDITEGALNLFYTAARAALKQSTSAKGAPSGYASLNGSGKVPRSQLPGYTDDVLEYDTVGDFPGTGTSGKIYIALDSGLTYYWTGAAYALSGTSATNVTLDGVETLTNKTIDLTVNTLVMSKAELDAAVSDGNVLWVGDVTQYTDEMARDALGTALTAGTGITITPNDGADTIAIATTITQYTDEMARDALGTALTAGTGISITPNDGADTITIALDGTATTASAGDNDTSIATTAFVDATLYATDNAQSGTTYTLVLADYRKEISLTHATGCALTIPTNASVAFPVGTRIAVWNDSAGTHTIVGASGVTLNGISAGTPTGTITVNASGVRGGVLLRKTATNTWTVTGSIGAVA